MERSEASGDRLLRAEESGDRLLRAEEEIMSISDVIQLNGGETFKRSADTKFALLLQNTIRELVTLECEENSEAKEESNEAEPHAKQIKDFRMELESQLKLICNQLMPERNPEFYKVHSSYDDWEKDANQFLQSFEARQLIRNSSNFGHEIITASQFARSTYDGYSVDNEASLAQIMKDLEHYGPILTWLARETTSITSPVFNLAVGGLLLAIWRSESMVLLRRVLNNVAPIPLKLPRLPRPWTRNLRQLPKGSITISNPQTEIPIALMFNGIEVLQPEVYSSGRVIIHELQPLKACRKIWIQPGRQGIPCILPPEPGHGGTQLILQECVQQLNQNDHRNLASQIVNVPLEIIMSTGITIFAQQDSELAARGKSLDRVEGVKGLYTYKNLISLTCGSILEGISEYNVAVHKCPSGGQQETTYLVQERV